MSRRPPGEARFLGLWTAGWLALLILIGLLVAGDIRVQWPVFAVPLLWALVALRPRRRGPRVGRYERPADDDGPGFWDDEPPRRPAPRPSSPGQRFPPTRETGTLPPPPPWPEDRRRG